jgi:hypothetical protein
MEKFFKDQIRKITRDRKNRIKSVWYEIPILYLLHQLRGSARPKELYPFFSKYVPFSNEDLEFKGETNTHYWENILNWARQNLVNHDEVINLKRGVWQITEKGLLRLKSENIIE